MKEWKKFALALIQVDLKFPEPTLPLVRLISAIYGLQQSDGVEHARFAAPVRSRDHNRRRQVPKFNPGNRAEVDNRQTGDLHVNRFLGFRTKCLARAN